MIKKDFVLYEEALTLKELGFDEESICLYKSNKECIAVDQHWGASLTGICKKDGYWINENEYLAPLYSQVFRWFREKHNLSFECYTPDGKEGKWKPQIHKINGYGNYYDNDGFDSYEEAELNGLKKLIEIVKNK